MPSFAGEFRKGLWTFGKFRISMGCDPFPSEMDERVHGARDMAGIGKFGPLATSLAGNGARTLNGFGESSHGFVDYR